jgi:integrase
MSTKFPKPWYRATRGVWYVTLEGQQINLGPDKEAAFEHYHQLMMTPADQRLLGETLAEILDAFLEWCKANRAIRTYEWYLNRCQQFLNFLPKGIEIAQLKPYHLQRWIDSYKGWAPGNKRNACRAIQRGLSWAVQQGYIEKSPLQHFQKPPAGRRDLVVTPTEFAKLLESTRDRVFRDLLQITWETGARPQETLRVEHRHVDLEHRRWIFPPHEAKGGKLPRIIYLNDVALEITQRWMERNRSGKLFRNTQGRPWTTYAVNCRFATLKRKLKKRYCLYALRHTWATTALKKGVDPITVSVLMGHSDTNMLARTYAHLTHDLIYLQAAAQRVTA